MENGYTSSCALTPTEVARAKPEIKWHGGFGRREVRRRAIVGPIEIFPAAGSGKPDGSNATTTKTTRGGPMRTRTSVGYEPLVAREVDDLVWDLLLELLHAC
jgi:hypothetical protein